MAADSPVAGGIMPSGCGTRPPAPVSSCSRTPAIPTPSSLAWPGVRTGGGSRDGGELFVWDAHSGERHPAWGAGNRDFERHAGVVSALTWGPSGELLLSGGSDGRLRWWEVHSGQCVRVQEAHQGAVQSL